MDTQLAKVRNGSISLSPKLAQAWRGVTVYVIAGRNAITLKKVEEPSLTELLPLLKKAGKGLQRRNVAAEIRIVRSSKKR